MNRLKSYYNRFLEESSQRFSNQPKYVLFNILKSSFKDGHTRFKPRMNIPFASHGVQGNSDIAKAVIFDKISGRKFVITVKPL